MQIWRCQAQQESLSYEQYLLALAELECITRQNNRIETELEGIQDTTGQKH